MIVRICLAIPTYNNHQSIEKVLRDCLTESPVPILVVDDGSQPPLLEFLPQDLTTHPRIRILRNSENSGKGVAIQKAVEDCVARGFTHLMTWDGDGQHLPSALRPMMQACRAHPWDLIIGHRTLTSSDVPGATHFGRKFSNFWVKFQTGVPVSDSQSGLRIYPLFFLQTLQFWTQRYDFEIEVLVRLLWRQVGIQEVPIEVYYPPRAERVSHFHKWKDNARISFLNTGLVVGSFFQPFRFAFLRPRRGANWNGRMRGGRIGNGILKWVTCRLGVRAAYGLLYFIIPYFYIFAPKARRGAQEYWKILEPQDGVWKRQLRVVRQLFRFAQILLDRLAQTHSSQLLFFAHQQGLDHIQNGIQSGRGLILLTAHVGGWDVAAHSLRAQGFGGQFSTVQYEAARPFSRGNAGVTVFQIRESLEQGIPIGLMGDRPMGNQFELVSFFGKLAPFDVTPFRVAAACQAPLIVTFGFKGQGLAYEFVAEPAQMLRYSSEENRLIQCHSWVQEYARTLEAWIRKYPEQWTNFYPFWSSLPTPPPGWSAAPAQDHLQEELNKPTRPRPGLEFARKPSASPESPVRVQTEPR